MPTKDKHCEQLVMIRVTRSSRFFILKLTFVVGGRHSLLWPEVTTFERSHKGCLQNKEATVRCGQMPQYLKIPRTITIWSVGNDLLTAAATGAPP